jgi:hypothetical protein
MKQETNLQWQCYIRPSPAVAVKASTSAKCRSDAHCSGSSRSRNGYCFLQLIGGGAAFSGALGAFPIPTANGPHLSAYSSFPPCRAASATSLLLRAPTSSSTAHPLPHPRHLAAPCRHRRLLSHNTPPPLHPADLVVGLWIQAPPAPSAASPPLACAPRGCASSPCPRAAAAPSAPQDPTVVE